MLLVLLSLSTFGVKRGEGIRVGAKSVCELRKVYKDRHRLGALGVALTIEFVGTRQ